MTRTKGALRWGANFAALSAALHFVGLVVGGFGAEAMGLLPFGVVYGAIAFGLFRGWRWLAYIAFVVLLFGASLAISNIWAFGAVPGWVYSAIAAANLLSVAALFGALWKTPNASA